MQGSQQLRDLMVKWVSCRLWAAQLPQRIGGGVGVGDYRPIAKGPAAAVGDQLS